MDTNNNLTVEFISSFRGGEFQLKWCCCWKDHFWIITFILCEKETYTSSSFRTDHHHHHHQHKHQHQPTHVSPLPYSRQPPASLLSPVTYPSVTSHTFMPWWTWQCSRQLGVFIYKSRLHIFLAQWHCGIREVSLSDESNYSRRNYANSQPTVWVWFGLEQHRICVV